MNRIGPCLWFNGQAEQAADFYVAIFKDSHIIETSTYLAGSPSPFPVGSVMTVKFMLDGIEFTALNGGPEFTFTPAISLVVTCRDQAEVDYYWSRLLADGGQESVCGWLTDRFGVSWQVVPALLDELVASPA
jgi:predicted 3-demethylubiquinone-9 3-methyltransferase (glyoxalase superfamily)